MMVSSELARVETIMRFSRCCRVSSLSRVRMVIPVDEKRSRVSQEEEEDKKGSNEPMIPFMGVLDARKGRSGQLATRRDLISSSLQLTESRLKNVEESKMISFEVLSGDEEARASTHETCWRGTPTSTCWPTQRRYEQRCYFGSILER